MAFVTTTDGLASLAAYNGTVLAWLNSLTLKLWENNHVVVVTDHVASLTEATFSGYASQAFNDAVLSGLDGNNNELYTWPDHTFTQTGVGVTDNVYGAYWIDGAGKLVLAQNRATPLAMDTVGNECIVRANPGMALGQLSGSP